MRLLVESDYDAMSAAAVRQISRLIESKPNAAIMLAAGSTPLGAYAGLVEKVRNGELDLSGVRFFQLDAYQGESDFGEEPSFSRWLRQTLLDPAGISGEQLVRIGADAAEFERAIVSAGGLDLAVLGLGVNGHVGFNEPPARPDSRTRAVDLLPETIAANETYWGAGKRVPQRGLTAGIGTILESERLLMLVSGNGKAEALRRCLEGEVSDDVPASHLRSHPGFGVIADQEAASRLAGCGSGSPRS